MNQLLSAAITEAAAQSEHFVGNTFAERTMYALSHTAVGMLLIFGVLGVIWAILAVFKVIFGGKSEKKGEAPVKQVQSAPAPAAKPASAPVAAPATSDEEIVAAITAAITLMREAEGATGTFRVVSFRRTGGARPWNQA